jgi:hypothetical protein
VLKGQRVFKNTSPETFFKRFWEWGSVPCRHGTHGVAFNSRVQRTIESEKIMQVDPDGQTTRKVEVKVFGKRVARCEETLVVEVPYDASDEEIQGALQGYEPDGWLWEEGWWLEAETEMDDEEDPEVIGSARHTEIASASLVRDEDGTLVLEDLS